MFSPRNLSNRGAPEARGASPGPASFSVRFTQRIAPNGVCCLVGHRRRRHPFYGEIGILLALVGRCGGSDAPCPRPVTPRLSALGMGLVDDWHASGAVPSGATVKLPPLYTGSRLNRPRDCPPGVWFLEPAAGRRRKLRFVLTRSMLQPESPIRPLLTAERPQGTLLRLHVPTSHRSIFCCGQRKELSGN